MEKNIRRNLPNEKRGAVQTYAGERLATTVHGICLPGVHGVFPHSFIILGSELKCQSTNKINWHNDKFDSAKFIAFSNGSHHHFIYYLITPKITVFISSSAKSNVSLWTLSNKFVTYFATEFFNRRFLLKKLVLRARFISIIWRLKIVFHVCKRFICFIDEHLTAYRGTVIRLMLCFVCLQNMKKKKQSILWYFLQNYFNEKHLL